ILPALDGNHCDQTVTLTFNDSGRFEDRWVYLKGNPQSPCVFTKGIDGVYLPVRHGEGKLIAKDSATLWELQKRNLVAFRYCDAAYKPTMTYPMNPNGSAAAIAGICNETGRLFGLMPHPEAYLHYTNHPRWTREELPEEGMGLALFRNAVSFIRSKNF
ncbi:MAG: phosphoribosylformylglycinamidine synthase subunit PurQ, partial [Smithellaceae bacterium]|nr:phosphoribosylformylglycinamidine synthase subunit PurQ [Smithellaceae bacterium]